ncbi:hypothetical protein [Azohydromonas sediminis]|uniref:hypothetical protein n=1 Tax=Azohydromonas sediminis TaxID=2259674 RepID=UPI000E647DC9|nr:hypothetical protein [Azohydromonas sediminis]
MSPSALVAIEFALVIGVVLGLGIWQLVAVRREIARDRERASRPPPAGDAPPHGGTDSAAPRADVPSDPDR